MNKVSHLGVLAVISTLLSGICMDVGMYGVSGAFVCITGGLVGCMMIKYLNG